MTRPGDRAGPTRSAGPARPARRACGAAASLAVALMAVGPLAACGADPPSTSGSPTVPFETELAEAEQMIERASALVGDPAPPVHRNSDGANVAGAPDPSQQRRDISVTWVQASPPPFAEIRDLWTGSFGFTVTSEDSRSVFLGKGEMTASINEGLPAADGARNVWFGVTTGLHPAAEVPDP